MENISVNVIPAAEGETERTLQISFSADEETARRLAKHLINAAELEDGVRRRMNFTSQNTARKRSFRKAAAVERDIAAKAKTSFANVANRIQESLETTD